MNPDTVVELVIVTPSNWMVNLCFLEQARRIINEWVEWRVAVRTNAKGKDADEARSMLARGTLSCRATEADSPHFAVGWEYVIGMYVREHRPTAQDRLASVMEKSIEVVQRESNRGEEWKGEDEE